MLPDDVVRPRWSREREPSPLAVIVIHAGIVFELLGDGDGVLVLRADDLRTGRPLWRRELGHAVVETVASMFPPQPRARLLPLDDDHVVVAATTERELVVHRVAIDGGVRGTDRFVYTGSLYGPAVDVDGGGFYAASFTSDGIEQIEVRDAAGAERALVGDARVWIAGDGRLIARVRPSGWIGIEAATPYRFESTGFADNSIVSRIHGGMFHATDIFWWNEWAESPPDDPAPEPPVDHIAYDAVTGKPRWRKRVAPMKSRRELMGDLLVELHDGGKVDVHAHVSGELLATLEVPDGVRLAAIDRDRTLLRTDAELALASFAGRTLWSIPPPGVGEYDVEIVDELLVFTYEHSLHVAG